ncbi:MAG: hypothetical protein ACXWKM_14515 [Phenylobacterium sp.]
MHWPMFLLAVFASTVVASFTDWLFMGVLFHDAYNRHPEVWRDGVREGKSRGAILWSVALGYLMTAAVVFLCVLAGVARMRAGLLVGALCWVAPASVVVINNMFVKVDRRITIAHCAGYGARLLVAGAAAGLALGRLVHLAG